MKPRLTLDKAGQIVIPKPLREELHLEPGALLELEVAGEQITLRPVRGTAPLTKERGIWVSRTGQPLPATSADETLRQIREERDQWLASRLPLWSEESHDEHHMARRFSCVYNSV
jgi:AbrB family looped-hinge helix DNA binding protein